MQTYDRAGETAPWFVDIAQRTGLHFVHSTGATGEFYFPEIAGSGCALFDYDGDGDLDVYAIQCHPLDPSVGANRTSGMNRLFRNDLTVTQDGERRMRFTDATAAAGAGDRGYGMGCAVGDYDNDGDLDLFVTNFGPNTLYRNNGDGTFTDVTDATMPANDAWSTSAAFVDYDRDGRLDLFVADYVNFSLLENKVCHSRSSRRDYCGPQSFDPVPDHLYHNSGDGTFADVSTAAGIDAAYGSGLGVVCADFNGDAWQDIYVANDGNANQLWLNRGDGTFENTALLAGAAYNAEGMPEAGMGVTAEDFDCDGDMDVLLAHLVGEHNTLLVNDGSGYFEDASDEMNLGEMSRPFTAFGVKWFDVEGDGDLDAFVANGAVKIAEEYAHLDYPYPYPNQLIVNTGPPAYGFRDASPSAGPDVTVPLVSRGAAYGDVDNDGDVDVLVSNSNGPLQLLRNDVGQRQPWITLRLIGADSNRSAIGALVRLGLPDRPPMLRRVHADASYCSANDLRVFFAVPDANRQYAIVVRWPNGARESFNGIAPDCETTVTEGTGVALPPRTTTGQAAAGQADRF